MSPEDYEKIKETIKAFLDGIKPRATLVPHSPKENDFVWFRPEPPANKEMVYVQLKTRTNPESELRGFNIHTVILDEIAFKEMPNEK